MVEFTGGFCMPEVEVEARVYRAVERLVRERPEFGYEGVGEFVREAVRMAFRKVDYSFSYSRL